ncbi:MAG: class I SAM-dependent rRNA methyltransferase [Planctomycetota bacterium]
MTLPIVRLIPRQTHRCLNGHPWVFRSELEPAALTDIADAAEIEVQDHRSRLIGRGFYSAQSQIAVRLATRRAIPLDRAFLRTRLQAAINHRATVMPGRSACRLVSSEGDLLPGLIVERYADRLVIQTTTSGIEARMPEILDLLGELCQPSQIVERNDFPARELEGLPRRAGVLRGPQETIVRVQLGDIDVDVDLRDPHKTGAYLDQIDSHRALTEWTPRGGRVADVFAHRGGFALHLLHAGAASAVAVDEAAAGLFDAIQAAERCGFAGRFNTVQADAFRWLREQDAAKTTFDLVVLDPPAFARTRAAVPGALRGYRDLHVHALRLLAPGGRLASWSCSSHVGETDFLNTAVEAAAEGRRTIRFDTAFGQPADHPWLPAAPETRYLKGFLLTVLE